MNIGGKGRKMSAFGCACCTLDKIIDREETIGCKYLEVRALVSNRLTQQSTLRGNLTGEENGFCACASRFCDNGREILIGLLDRVTPDNRTTCRFKRLGDFIGQARCIGSL